MKISNIKGIFSKMLSYTVKREFIITLMTCIAASIIIGEIGRASCRERV